MVKNSFILKRGLVIVFSVFICSSQGCIKKVEFDVDLYFAERFTQFGQDLGSGDECHLGDLNLEESSWLTEDMSDIYKWNYRAYFHENGDLLSVVYNTKLLEFYNKLKDFNPNIHQITDAHISSSIYQIRSANEKYYLEVQALSVAEFRSSSKLWGFKDLNL